MMKKNTVVALGVFIKIATTFKIDRFLFCDVAELSLVPAGVVVCTSTSASSLAFSSIP